MNYSTAVFLTSENVKMHSVVFSPDVKETTEEAYASHPKRYFYKTFQDDLEVGQYVVVPSSLSDQKTHGMSIAQIVELDIEVDFESTHQYKWIIGSLNLDDFEKIKEQEKVAISTIRAAEKNRKRKELKEDLDNLVGDDMKKIEFNGS